MKKTVITALQLLLALGLFAGSGLIFYKALVYPYFFQTAEDRDFLSHRPNRAEVFAYFKHRPEEQLKPGERFQMTGWRPLPERPATHYACVFVRMNGNKIYIFFDAEDRVEEFVIATS
jgi:hypothetical protein